MVGDLMDLHVYALLKRRYNELAESVEGILDEAVELTADAKSTLEDVKSTLSEIEPLLEVTKGNVEASTEQVSKVQDMLNELEPKVKEVETIVNEAKQFVHTGEYERDRAYLKGNETLYNGSTYRALEDVTGELPADSDKWQLVAQRGVDGKGAVSSVNNISPDENGNVDLGKITADWDDLEGKPEVLEGLGDEDGKLTYKGEEVGEKLVIGRKVYEADGNTSTFKTEFEVEPNTNRVMVFVGGVIQTSGANFTESKGSITLNFTPSKGTQVIVYTFSGSETLFVDGGGSGNVNSVAGILPDDTGDVPLAIGDLTTDVYMSPSTPPKEYPLGITTFRTNLAQSKEWMEYLGDTSGAPRVLVVTFKASEVWQSTQHIYVIEGSSQTGNTIKHRTLYVRSAMASTVSITNNWSEPVKIVDGRSLSDSTTSESSETIATSKAVNYLNQALIGTDDSLRETQRELKDIDSKATEALTKAIESFQLGNEVKQDLAGTLLSYNKDLPVVGASWASLINFVDTELQDNITVKYVFIEWVTDLILGNNYANSIYTAMLAEGYIESLPTTEQGKKEYKLSHVFNLIITLLKGYIKTASGSVVIKPNSPLPTINLPFFPKSFDISYQGENTSAYAVSKVVQEYIILSDITILDGLNSLGVWEIKENKDGTYFLSGLLQSQIDKEMTVMWEAKSF